MNNDSDSPGTGESQYNPRGLPARGFPLGGLPAGGFPPGGLPAGYQIPVPGGYYSFTPVNPSLHDGDNVYRPSLEGISFPVGDAVPEETPNLENETFSLSDLEISPYREDPPARERGRGRGSRRGKGKEAAGSSSQAEGRSKRVNYSVAESVAICRCWIDVSEDAVVSNMQSARGFWRRVAERYDRIRPAGTKAHNADQVRKHFERVKADVVRFMGIYENNLRTQASGQSHEDVKELSFRQFSHDGIYPSFKFWACFEFLKDYPKFQPGMPNAPKRTRLGESGNYSSTGGDTPDTGGSTDPLPSPPSVRRPAGVKASKRKGVASSSQSSVGQPSSGNNSDTFLKLQQMKTMLELVRRRDRSTDPDMRAMFTAMIDDLRRDMGYSGDGDAGTDGGAAD